MHKSMLNKRQSTLPVFLDILFALNGCDRFGIILKNVAGTRGKWNFWRLSEYESAGNEIFALREIRRYQKSTDLLIRKLPFQRLV